MSLSINFDGKANVSKKVENSNTKIQDAYKNAQVKTVDTKKIRAEMARLGISGEHVKMNDQAQNVKNSNTKIMDTLKNAQVKTVDTKEIRAEMARLGISGEHMKMNDQAQNVKLPTKEQIEAALKKVQSQDYDEITQEVQKYFEEQIRKDNEKAIRVLPYFPNLQKSE